MARGIIVRNGIAVSSFGDSTRRGRKFRDKQNKTWIKLRGINLDESGGNGLKSGESLENRDR